MKVITAPEVYKREADDITVFLAGGINKCWEWQDEVIKELDKINAKNLVVFNPRRKDFPIDDPNAAEEQINWEFNMLEQCDIFSMYFCEGESDQPICMYELGRNICRMQMRFPINCHRRIIISLEDNYKRRQDVMIQTRLALGLNANIFINKNIDDHIRDIIGAYSYFNK